MDGSAIFVLHTITHTLYCYNWTFHCFSVFFFSETRYIVYSPLFQPLLYQNCDLAPCTITQLSLVTHKEKKSKKKSMYKNTEIQQKDSVATGAVAGAMAPFTGQIRTSQERKEIPAQNRQHLQMAERMWSIRGVCLRCLLNHWTDF